MVHLNRSRFKMHFFYTIVCLCIIAFNWYDARVDALLNITEEALATSRRFLEQVEGNLRITTEDELRQKISIINQIAYDFENKYKHEIEDDYDHSFDWLDWLRQVQEIKNVSLVFTSKLVRFSTLKKKIDNVYRRNSVPVINKPRDMYEREFYAIAKNKLDLNIKESLTTLGDEHQYTQDIFRELYQLFLYADKESHISIFEFLKDTSKYVPELQLKGILKTTPPQLRLFHTIRDVIYAEAFFCVKHQYYVALLKLYAEGLAFLKNEDRRALDLIKYHWRLMDAVTIMRTYEEKFQERNVEVLDKIKPALFSLSRYLSQTDQPSGYSTVKLQVFTQYIVNEVDLNPDGTCKKTCPEYKQVERVFGCFDGGICSIHKKCKGKLLDCENIPFEPAYICSWDKKKENEDRYMYISGYKRLEHENNCQTEVQTTESWRRGFYKCSYCQCKCEESETYSNRYFSLRPATSNIYDNYVVIGVSFELMNHVVHLQVSQAKLLPNGQLGKKETVPIRLFNVTNYDIVAGKDFQTITADARTVCLDSLESPNDHLLTGVRLAFKNGYFKLEIRMTQFDYASGNLYPERSIWYSKDSDLNQRSEIDLYDFYTAPLHSIKSDGCFRFTTNKLGYRGSTGEDTIPYIDESVVSPDRKALLSGAGIIIKKGTDEKEYLSFQLVSHDIAGHL